MALQATSAFGQPNQLVLEPYVTLASFTASPTYLDIDDLIPGGNATQQNNELLNVLLRASNWCDVVVGGAQYPYLGSHQVTENFRIRSRRDGSLSMHPSHGPVRQVVSLYTGTNPLGLSQQTVANLWIEDDRQVIVPAAGSAVSNFSGLQFGSPVGSQNWQTFVQLTYVSGWANSTLPTGSTIGATSLTVFNPAGINPGDALRIQDPLNTVTAKGGEEFVQVANTYVPTVTPNTAVPLVAGTLNAHNTGAGITAMPLNIQQAVICYAVGLLLREDVTFEEPFAATTVGPTARMSMSGGVAGGLIEEAVRLLQPYARIR
jgi:hypothetical protein